MATPTPMFYNATASDRTQASGCRLRNLLNDFGPLGHKRSAPHAYPRLPEPSKERLEASLNEREVDLTNLSSGDIRAAEEKEKTVLYLAYGSNLCNETFRGKRGIRPISQINVQVPFLRLTFDLPGIPYVEPCFSNTAPRDPDEDNGSSKEGMVSGEDYHKDRWHKGLIGCVYEVTPSDYAHIIATEGGGASYKDILVDCHPLPDAPTVPQNPSTIAFKAHTLFAPPATDDGNGEHATDRFKRPDPSYAQPSARYMKLITDGATELSLPAEYQAFLSQIRPYTITTKRQQMGQALLLATWLPLFTFVFALQSMFQDDKGRIPKWLAQLMGFLFSTLWKNYDMVYKKPFGDGERTIGDGDDDATLRRPKWLASVRKSHVEEHASGKC